MIKINCIIPNKLSVVSEYVLTILGDRLGIQFFTEKKEVLNHSFKHNEKIIEFPAYFVIHEAERFLRKRNIFPYSLDRFEYKNEVYHAVINNDLPNKRCHFDVDIIGTIFILLSRYEEHVLNRESHFDKFGRFKYKSAINSFLLNQPIVDELIDFFRLIIEDEFNIKLVTPNRKFEVSPSHDVDRPFKYLFSTRRKIAKRLLGDVFKRKSTLLARKRTNIYKRVRKGDLKADPYNTFQWIIDTSLKYDVTSTFHFLVKSINPKFDGDYNIDDHVITDLLKLIHVNAHKIGLHPSFNATIIPGQIEKEFNELKKICETVGIKQKSFKSRNHYLRWNNHSISELEKAGIEIDQTLTFAQKPGFKTGTSISYPAFNFDSMKISSVTIEPLIMMEQSLLSFSYMGLRNDLPSAWNIVQNLKNQCKKHSGTFTTLWHNNMLIEDDLKQFYEECIK